jgi:hypothetical protein
VRVIAVDWSGALSHPERRIYSAEFIDGKPRVPENGRNREQLAGYLLDLAAKTPEIIVGLDFAFSCPGWFVKEHNCSSAIEFWSIVEEQGEGWLRKCPHPFWGRCGRKRPDGKRLFRQTEMSTEPVAGIAPKSVFQLAGAGHVGTGSLRGMPVLKTLRQNGFSIWPFDTPRAPLVIEIYPRILTGKIRKSNHQALRRFLSDSRFNHLPMDWRETSASCEDAFDAAISAWQMHQKVDQLRSLTQATALQDLLEGTIWTPAASN